MAFTATRISRLRGSGLAVSKSISASAASIGSDFFYPTAFMLMVSFCWRLALLPNCRSGVNLASTVNLGI
jgi:hypothetical protein